VCVCVCVYGALKAHFLDTLRLISVFNTVVSLLRRSVADLSPLRPGLNSRPFHVMFMVEELAL
jgi:hypothetical protein